VELAVRLDAEIVNADSMQVFRGFDIGTAKPSSQEMRGVPHHLFDIVKADDSFDASCFIEVADAAIDDIASRGKRVLVVGGTGLYIRVLLHGLQAGPPPDPLLRQRLLARAAAEGRESLHKSLAELDPETARRLHPNDIVRVVRALETAMTSGTTITKWQQSHGFKENRYDYLLLGLSRPRAELHATIEKRVEAMMAAGFLDEVRNLLDRGVDPSQKPMQALGYKRLVQFLKGELSLNDAVIQIKTDTRRFAKRQETWFKKEPGLQWVEPNADFIESLCRTFWVPKL
jgi:tRNA dimethylallyltransferase